MSKTSELVLQYEPFIRKWARQLCRKLGIYDKQRAEDILQGCYIAAVRVVDTGAFDPTRGDFSSYLCRFCASMAIRESGVMNDAFYLPPRVRLLISRISAELDKNPRVESALLAKQLKAPLTLVKRVKEGLRTGVALSLDAPVHGDDFSLLDVLEQPEDDTDSELERISRLARIRSTGLPLLTLREQDIICARYFTSESETLRSVARRHGVTAERVRQIEVKAMKKIRDALA